MVVKEKKINLSKYHTQLNKQTLKIFYRIMHEKIKFFMVNTVINITKTLITNQYCII